MGSLANGSMQTSEIRARGEVVSLEVVRRAEIPTVAQPQLCNLSLIYLFWILLESNVAMTMGRIQFYLPSMVPVVISRYMKTGRFCSTEFESRYVKREMNTLPVHL